MTSIHLNYYNKDCLKNPSSILAKISSYMYTLTQSCTHTLSFEYFQENLFIIKLISKMYPFLKNFDINLYFPYISFKAKICNQITTNYCHNTHSIK